MGFFEDLNKPAVTVDNVIFTFKEKELQVLLIRRKNDPFKGNWALPGGFVELNESLEHAAQRELEEETGIIEAFAEQFYTFGAVDRDPRGRVISVGFYALVKWDEVTLKADSDATEVNWFSLDELPDLAFDHDIIISTAFTHIKTKLKVYPIGFELLPDNFTLTELQRLYESILDKPLDKRNFRKKILNLDVLSESKGNRPDVTRRAATLYKFDKHKYVDLKEKGGKFQLY